MRTRRLHRENGGYTGVPAEVTADPYWDSCVFALSGQGANGSTPSTDVTGKALTWSGGAAISTAQSVFYGSSISTNAGAGVVSTPDHASLDGFLDFYIRLRFYATASGGALLAKRASSAAYGAWDVAFVSNKIRFEASSNGSSYDICNSVSGATTLALSAWHTAEIGRIGSAGFIFVNGVLDATFSSSAQVYNDTSALYIGGDSNASFNGFLTDAQIWSGACLSASSHAVPTRDMLTSARRYVAGVHSL